MPGHYSHTTRAAGTVLTATIYNADHQNHIDNDVPLMMDDYSVDVAQMQASTNPGGVGTESQATTLAGELERLRFVLTRIHGLAQWYSLPTSTNWGKTPTGNQGGTAFELLPRLGHNFIGGLRTSNNVSDATNDIDIAIGECMDATNAKPMRLTSAITKRLDASWAVGTNQGGLDTGAKANSTGYYVWLIMRSDTGVVDALFSTSATAPTMPANYDYKRLIGFIKTTSAGVIYAFTQVGDHFQYSAGNANAIDISDSSITSNTFETAAVSVPANSLAHLFVVVSNTSAQAEIRLQIGAGGDASDSGDTVVGFQTTDSTSQTSRALISTLVDASSQIRYSALETSGTASVYIWPRGFTMLTRSMPI